MTKKELNQIYYINREIKMWRRELEKLENKSLVKSQEITDMPGGRNGKDNTADIAIKKADIEAIIKGLLSEANISRYKIMKYLCNVEDSLMRQIIFLRCVSCLPWSVVAEEVGGENTEDSVRMSFNRYVERE